MSGAARLINEGETTMAVQKSPDRVISIFRFRMKNLSAAEREEYAAMAERLYKIASAMPGFISLREYEARNGESLGITEWASAEALAAWRQHPEHRQAQERGQQVFYAEYDISVCTPLREYSFKGGQRSAP